MENATADTQASCGCNPDGTATMQENVPLLSQTVEEGTQIPIQVTERVKPLPLGWVIVAHESGVMVYLHKESRVVTLSRPYHLSSSVTVKVLKETISHTCS